MENKAGGAPPQPPKLCQSCLTDLERRLSEHKEEAKRPPTTTRYQPFVLSCSDTDPPEGKSAGAHKDISGPDGAFSPKGPFGVYKEDGFGNSARTGDQTTTEKDGSTGASTDMYITPSPGVNKAKAIQDWLVDSCCPGVNNELEGPGGVFLDARGFPAAGDRGITEAYNAGPSDCPPEVPPHRCKHTLPSNMISPHLASQGVGNGSTYFKKSSKSTPYFLSKESRAVPQTPNFTHFGPGAIFETRHAIATNDTTAPQTERSSWGTRQSNPRSPLFSGRIPSESDTPTKTCSSGVTSTGSRRLRSAPSFPMEGYEQLGLDIDGPVGPCSSGPVYLDEVAVPGIYGRTYTLSLSLPSAAGLTSSDPNTSYSHEWHGRNFSGVPIAGSGRPGSALRDSVPTSVFFQGEQVMHLPPNPADVPGFDPSNPYPPGTDSRESTSGSRIASSDIVHNSRTLEVVLRMGRSGGRSGVPPTTDHAFVLQVSGQFDTPSTGISNENEKDPTEESTTRDETRYLKGEKEYGTVTPALRRRV